MLSRKKAQETLPSKQGNKLFHRVNDKDRPLFPLNYIVARLCECSIWPFLQSSMHKRLNQSGTQHINSDASVNPHPKLLGVLFSTNEH